MAIETLAWGYGLIEGPRVDADDNLYFSDVPNGGVYRRSPAGQVTVAIPKRRGVGGIALHADGGLVVSGRNIAHVRDGVTRILYEQEGVGGFNDLFADSAGRVYIGSLRSDPFATEGTRAPGEGYVIDQAGSARQLYDNIGLTNGIGLSPDGRRLYHVDSAARSIVVHDRADDATVSNREVFAKLPKGETPDGLAVDEQGGVWVAVVDGGQARRYRPDGEPDIAVHVPASFVTSVCFGGADRRDLYIVSADNTDDPARKGSIFRTRVDVPGCVVHPVRI